jgi:uncharacterized LabA/DUF88 family protein
MNDKDLSPNGGPPTNTSANANAATEAAAHPRHHRRPARTPRGTETNVAATETVAETKPVAETSAVPAEALEGAAQNSHPEKTPNRPARGQRGGRGRATKATPATADSTEPSVAEFSGPVTEPETPAPAITAPRPAQQAIFAAAPSEPTKETAATATTANVPEETPRPAHRYRFDRRPPSAFTPVPTTPAPVAPTAPAPEMRRASTLWSRPAPAPQPQPEAAPREEVMAFTPTPTFAPPSLPVQPEPEEIVLPLVATPAATVAPQTAPEIEIIEIVEEDDTTEEVSPANTNNNSMDDARRGRRRRRGGRTGNVNYGEPQTEEPVATFVAPAPVRPQPRLPQQPQTYSPPPTPTVPEQPEPTSSAYGSPEPAHARGFGPVTRGVATEFRGAPTFSRSARSSEGAPISANHLASIIMDAMQQQTDRLLAEQRRHGASSSFTIAMPSTERVGVFVDVANLLYSSRSMRLPIDFGRLLTFLRSDRRLVRAHAYCPTSPEPYADQQFLQAVKGLGYRITTKDYKTFSSGAKKADLDLDLCMDIVRIVDAKAVDTIVLVSGDSDFLPLLDYCSDHGVRVEVAAFDESTAAILRQSCDLFLNLSVVEEIRA